MSITINKESFERFFVRGERYALVNAHGERAGYQAWTQRPSAERAARFTGHGVYDKREDKVIIEPDNQRRQQILRDSIESLTDKLDAVDLELSKLIQLDGS